MEDDIAIKVDNVYKDFILPHERTSSIKSVFTGLAKGNAPWKEKESQRALKDISFDVKKGEFFGIVGRNGSGKSTLLKIIASIYQPTKGKIDVKGKLVPFIELGVGFNPELTGRENVYLNGAMLGFSKREVENMYEDIVEFAELERFMDQKLKNYSSGMQVRLAFSMATRSKADILLIDEVLAVGDADFQRKCFNYFKTLKRDEKTVVFVTHDMEAVREYCDRAMLIENSRVTKIGSTSEITQSYTKLFNSNKENISQSTEEGRWGDNSVRIEKIDIKIKSKVQITIEIKAKKDIQGPIVGFRVRDASGKEILGTNTKIEEHKLPSMKAGDSLSIIWEIENIFADGRYILDPAVLHNDAITVADWWDEAAQFTVNKSRHVPYPIYPGFKVKTERKSTVK